MSKTVMAMLTVAEMIDLMDGIYTVIVPHI